MTILVGDENDNTPQLVTSSLSFQVSEGSSVGVVIHLIRATDLDEPNTDNSLISFTSSDIPFPFALNQDGSIILTAPLDYENQTNFQFTVTATDNGLYIQ